MKGQRFQITKRIREFNYRVDELCEIKKLVVKGQGRFFKKYDYQAITSVFKDYAAVKAQLWNEIMNEYPELEGKSVELNGRYILEKGE